MFFDTLRQLIDFIQMSEFGEVDPSITFAFEPLWSLDDLQEAAKRKTEADTDAVYLQEGVLHPEEVRARIATDPDTPYQGLDVSDVPEPPADPSKEPNPLTDEEDEHDSDTDDSASDDANASSPFAATSGCCGGEEFTHTCSIAEDA